MYARARAHAFVRVCHAAGSWWAVGSCVRVQTLYLPACADSYVLGALDSNACPAGSYRITDAAQCEAAATAAGIAWGGPADNDVIPTGCVWNIPQGSSPGVGGNQKVLLNTATGNGHRIYDRLICGRGTGLPARPPSCSPARPLARPPARSSFQAHRILTHGHMRTRNCGRALARP